jgi:hypothetical protein
VFEAGPLGVADGGMVFLQASPFWGWSTPQVTDEAAPGFTQVTTDAAGVHLEPATIDRGLLGIRVTGRRLEAGERVRVVYGGGPAGALADRYAERGSRFWFAVDGDGDGVRALVADSPSTDVAPGPPAALVVLLPSVARPGDTVRLTASVLDATGSTGVEVAGEVAFEAVPAGLEVPPRALLAPGGGGRATVAVGAPTAGIYRVRGRVVGIAGAGDLAAESNPLEVSARGPRVLWADLHGHSNFSDGTGLPEDYFGYARDVAALDVVALTDHDHWGMQFVDQHPELWEEIRRQTHAFHEPGRFVTLLGYEWTSWLWGHRHVLYFDGEGTVHSSIDPATETPAALWRALDGREALTIAHHTAGGPIATDWAIAPDPRFEPVTEVVSVHGSSEAWDSPSRIYSPVEGNFARDALDRGYRLGFLGSGDSHDGHPGLAHLAAPTGGLAGILAEELTRAAVLAALRARRVYATSGPRIILRFALDDAPMGSTVRADPARTSSAVTVRVVGTAPIAEIDLVRSGRVVERVPAEDLEVAWTADVAPLAAGEYVYVRVIQRDGGLAWSSPIFAE